MSDYSISVIGAGNMGHGFAAHFGIHDQDVTLIDHRESNLVSARDRIRGVIDFLNRENLTEMRPSTVEANIEYTTDFGSGVAEADIVLETVPESLEVKHEVLTEIAESAPDSAILASNTSSIPITDIAGGVDGHESRIAGCHWWYPPYLMRPVEIIKGLETSAETVRTLEDFLLTVDRDPVMVKRDVPGFVWNRVQRAVYRECLYMVEEGIASLEDINRAVRDGYATRTAAIGPFETIDIAGLEQKLRVTEIVQPTLCNDTEPSRLFSEYLNKGRGGIDDGAGFFDYDEPPAAITGRRDEKVAAIRRALEGM